MPIDDYTNRSELAEDREMYTQLADEMNDADVGPWVEEDWDESAVAGAKRFARRMGLRFPPSTGDYDRWYEKYGNCDGTRSHKPGLCEACDDAFADLKAESEE